MTPLGATAFAAGLLNLGLTILIVRRNPNSSLNRVYMMWSLAVVLWNFASCPLVSGVDERYAYRWMLMLQTGVLLLPATLFHLSVVTAEIRIPRLILPAIYASTAGFVIALFLGGMITGVEKLGVGYWAVANWGYYVFILFFLAVTLSTMLILYHQQGLASPLKRVRLRALLGAILGLWVFGTNDLLPIFGVRHYPFTEIPFVPVGNIASIGYAFVVGYSVMQHQLLDVHISLSRASAHIIRVVFLSVIGLFFLSAAMALFPKAFNGTSFMVSCLVITLSGIVASTLFPRLFGAGAETLERRLLGDKFQYQDKIDAFTTSVPWYTDTDALFDDLNILLRTVIQVRSFQIVLADTTSRKLTLYRGHPADLPANSAGLTTDSALFRFLRRRKSNYYHMRALPREESRVILKELENFSNTVSFELCFPLYSEGEPFGFLLIGKKESEEPYTSNDLELLTQLVKNLSLVINQVRLKEEIEVERELDLLGRMSRGLAHDLNNLLTPVWTFLQVTASTGSGDSEMDQLVKTAINNVHTMRSYIRDSLFFSRTLKPQMAEGRLEEVVEAAINLLRANAREKNITVRFNPAASVVGLLDLVLFQRLIANLLSNAIDASPPGSIIDIDLTPNSMPHNKEWFRLRVIDHGEGISPANLERIKAAFFTTKDSGDGKRGFGLGLAICRKIVHLHGGTLNISSQQGRGTTVQVDLPNGTKPAFVQEPELANAG